jgi:Kef-type K+ transport system membrane component KefB
MKKNLPFYILTLLIFGGLLWLVLSKGKKLEANMEETSTHAKVAEDIPAPDFFTLSGLTEQMAGTLAHPLSILILQIITIIIFSRILGYLFSKIGQPTVIGEIIAGIVLGPSILGAFFPAVSGFIFPPESLKNIQFLSQMGLILFMFIIGMELDLKVLKNQARSAVVISHISIIFPYFLGVGLAYYLFENYAPAQVSFLAFALFMGIAMSITAFPVLARILQERGLTKTAMGTMALTCAAADDITAWCILAVVIAIIHAGSPANALVTIGLAVVYISAMLFIIRPLLKKIGSLYITRETLNKTVAGLVFIALFLSAYTTEVIGIHALFGAFMAGVIMPSNYNFKKLMTEKIEDFSLIVLLPLFFAFTGLRTQMGLLNDSGAWIVCGIIIAVAVVGKFGGSMFAARFVGNSWKDSISIGALMNTRGLMELVVLNIGYDLGILSPEIFAMLVIMALVTTFMTGPTLSLVEYFNRKKPTYEEKPEDNLRILISFGPSQMGATLLKIAHGISDRVSGKDRISALHLTPDTEISIAEGEEYKNASFAPLRYMAGELDIKVETIYKTAEDVTREIISTAKKGDFNFLLIGGAKSLFNENLLGGRVKKLLSEVHCNTGIFIDKELREIRKILLLVKDESDLKLVMLANRMAAAEQTSLTIMDITGHFGSDHLKKQLGNLKNTALISNRILDKSFIETFDLVIIELHFWEEILMARSRWLQYCPSTLIVKLVADPLEEEVTLESSSMPAQI